MSLRAEFAVTDYGDNNPLYYDYYGFAPSFYELAFRSKGDKALASHIVDTLQQVHTSRFIHTGSYLTPLVFICPRSCALKAGLPARLTTTLEPRGQDGLGRSVAGLDHGVFVPFRLMFGEELRDIPIIQVSMDGSLKPEKNWELGKAVTQLRSR